MQVYRLSELSATGMNDGNYRFVSVEPYLDGHYLKYNTNNGYVRPVREEATRLDIETCQAFSHFSFQRTGGKEMVVDLQGIADVEEPVGNCPLVVIVDSDSLTLTSCMSSS